MIRDLLEQANDIQTKLNLLEEAKKEIIYLTDPGNITFHEGIKYYPRPLPPDRPDDPEAATIKNTRALRRLMEILK